MRWVIGLLMMCVALGCAEAAPKLRTAPVQLRKGPVGVLVDKFKQDAAAREVAPASGVDPIMAGLFQRLAKPVVDIHKFIGGDLNGAIALSTLIPTLQDGNGQRCYIAMRDFHAVFNAHPLPATLQVFTDFEALRLLTMGAARLCKNPNCNQISVDIRNAVRQATGPISIGLNVPTLNDLCAYIPDIQVVDPVTPVPPDPGADISALIPGTGGQTMPLTTPVPAPETGETSP